MPSRCRPALTDRARRADSGRQPAVRTRLCGSPPGPLPTTRAQEGILQAGRQLAKAQGLAINELKEARASATASLPSAAQLIETNYAFASQLLQIQKELT